MSPQGLAVQLYTVKFIRKYARMHLRYRHIKNWKVMIMADLLKWLDTFFSIIRDSSLEKFIFFSDEPTYFGSRI